MQIKEYISNNYQTTDAFCGLNSVEEELDKNGFLVVMDKDRYCGILTPRDVLLNRKKLVIDCISEKQSLQEEESISVALLKLTESRSPALAVFKGNELSGVLEWRKVMDAMEEKLNILDRQALVSQRVKNEFLNALSHEIRTPLNGILGFLNLLAEMDLNEPDEEYRKYTELINSNADSFLLTMNDLIELSLKQSEKEFSL
jgi:signal transduction histidine kinase